MIIADIGVVVDPEFKVIEVPIEPSQERPESYHSNTACCANCWFSFELGQRNRYRCSYGLPDGQYPTSKRSVEAEGTCDQFKEA